MAAHAAAVAAKTAARVVRMVKHGRLSREEAAAVVVQSYYRGHLARRALRALRGIVRLQALVRGYNVRKQAQMTMQCMQSLVRVQARARTSRLNLLNNGHNNNHYPTNKHCYHKNDLYSVDEYDEIDDRRTRYNGSNKSPISKDSRNDIIESQYKHDALLDREKALAYAFSCQERPQLGWNWLEHWMSTEQQLLRSQDNYRAQVPESSYTTITNTVLDNLSEKTVEIDTNLTQYNPTLQFPQHSDDKEERSTVRVLGAVPSYMAATQSAKAKARNNCSKFENQRRVQNRRHSGYSPDSSCGGEDPTPPFRGRLGKKDDARVMN